MSDLQNTAEAYIIPDRVNNDFFEYYLEVRCYDNSSEFFIYKEFDLIDANFYWFKEIFEDIHKDVLPELVVPE